MRKPYAKCRSRIASSFYFTALTIILYLVSTGLGYSAPGEQLNAMQVVKSYQNPKKATAPLARFNFEESLPSGEYVYIVEIDGEPLGKNPEFLRQRKNRNLIQQQNSTIQQMQSEMIRNQDAMLNKMRSVMGNKKPVFRYRYALNGFAIKMTQNEAKAIAEMDGIMAVTRDSIRTLDTDRGPTLIGAPNIWDGQIPSLLANQGEGIIVGILDSGVNTDHPSFAERADDGYVHTNPFGSGNYVGDCAGAFPELCNSKLIGIRSYPTITDAYSDLDVFPPNLPRNGEDYDGHGSHVAATAVGNRLLNLTGIVPEANTEESDGVASGFSFPEISGVAPRANLIAYQVCYPGEVSDNDTYAGCLTSVINVALDDAIADGVDVINFSISGGGDPWDDSTERAFLTANAAGIFVAVSAGNSGPNESSTVKSAPWYSAVAASEHGRENGFVKEINNFSGGINPPSAITGRSNTGGITAPVVYAGDFTNPNDPGNDPAQCLQPFPTGTFTGQIVLCDRGEIPRIEKAENVASGGAGGYILANIEGGDTFLADDQYVVPGIHVKVVEGAALRNWLASGSNHRATITGATPEQFIDEDRVDIVANFSSRGPNQEISTLTPTMTAPGVRIYSAFADQVLGRDGDEPPAAGDFGFLQGTSMSSPHVAGAAALLKGLYPDWSPDQIRSALSMTATPDMRLEDETTTADFFDMGAGRIRVNLAAQVGLTMDVTEPEYVNADPDLGGEPRSLNLPSITDNDCRGTCSWSRTFTATRDGFWSVSTEALTNGMTISASPESFDIDEGDSQTITVTINSVNTPNEDYAFGRLILESATSPDLVLPISALANVGNIPSTANVNLTRNVDEFFIRDLTLVSADNLAVTPYNLVAPTLVTGEVGEDSEPSEFIDDLNDGVSVTEIVVPENAKRLVTKISQTTAPDLDLFLVFDGNDDGFISSFEELARSNGSDSDEEIQVNFPSSGTYFIVVQNFSGSNAATDSFEIEYAIVENQLTNALTAEFPSNLSDNEEFDIRVLHDIPNLEQGTLLYGALGLSNDITDDDRFGIIELNFELVDFDTRIEGDSSRTSQGQRESLQVVVGPNRSGASRRYQITLPAPDGTEFFSWSTSNSGALVNNALVWEVTKPANNVVPTVLDFELNIIDNLPAGPINLSLSSELLDRDFTSVLSPPVFTGLQIEGGPSISVNNGGNDNFEVIETQNIEIPITTSDPNDDQISLSFNQTSGTTAVIRATNSGAIVTAPTVSANETLNFQVQASDGFGNTASDSFSLTVLNNQAPTISSISAPDSANTGASVTISFTASDPENDSLSFSIDGVSGASRTITLPSTGSSFSVLLSVTDGINNTTETVTIELISPAPSNSGGGGGGTMQGYFALFCLLIFCLRKRQR